MSVPTSATHAIGAHAGAQPSAATAVSAPENDADTEDGEDEEKASTFSGMLVEYLGRAHLLTWSNRL